MPFDNFQHRALSWNFLNFRENAVFAYVPRATISAGGFSEFIKFESLFSSFK